jgi:hypothetical protein
VHKSTLDEKVAGEGGAGAAGDAPVILKYLGVLAERVAKYK